MQQHQQNDGYSQEQNSISRKPRINPLHLSRQQLNERLLTLKNYGVWKRTKAKRINCKQLTGDQNSPIIHTAASYGYRYGYNQVFADFVKNEQQKTSDISEDAAQRYKGQDKNNRQQNANNKNQPSFISYKTDEREKQKIQRLINQSSRKESGASFKKKRCTTEPKMASDSTIRRKASPYPRQLANLKKKLKIFPSLHHRNRTEAAQFNPEQDNPTISMLSNSPQQSQAIRTDLPQKIQSSFQLQHPFELRTNNREIYLQNLHSIINMSSKLLSGSEGKGSSEADYIRMSSNSYNSAACASKKQPQDLKSIQKNRYLCYWPKYTRYGVSERDIAKFQLILKKCRQINGGGPTQKEDLNQMLALIKDQIAMQQSRINEEVLEEERNALEHKFDYKINLQREQYKKNIKELLRCKKQYRIQKQREEIRANGIKRMKKMGEVLLKMQKNTPKNDPQQD